MKNDYNGWELGFFDSAYNFRKYQFNLISNYIKGKTAEVGPGTGENLNYYYSKTDLLYLYEPSENLYNILKQKTQRLSNIKFFKEEFINVDEKFDTIIYLDVLEHIKEDKDEVIKAYSNLNKNGHLIINVPAFNFLYTKFDKDIGHHKRYNKNDFKYFSNILSKKPEKILYYDSIGFILILLSKIFFVSSKQNMSQKINLWNKLIPISKILDKISFFTFGKSLLCIFKK